MAAMLNRATNTVRKHCALTFLPLIALLLLAACSQSATATNTGSSPALGQTNATAALAGRGTFHEYPLPQSNSGVMRPVIDHEGRIWFGEMGHNYLAMFDPHTQTFRQMVPPHGADGIMGLAVAADDSIWFAEQFANYIGHYIPRVGRYQTYPLPMLKEPDPGNKNNTLTLPSAPNDLALDAQGNVWFTELNANDVGMLNVRTGTIKHYRLTVAGNAHSLNPYGIAIDHHGMVWFTEASTNTISQLDPHTGVVRTFTNQGPVNPFMEITCDTYGLVWATSFGSGLIVSLNPSTGEFTNYYAPSTGGNAGGVYGLTVTSENEVWVAVSSENAIARIDAATGRFTYYSIPTNASLPLGVVAENNHTLWFTEAASNKVGMLQW